MKPKIIIKETESKMEIIKWINDNSEFSELYILCIGQYVGINPINILHFDSIKKLATGIIKIKLSVLKTVNPVTLLLANETSIKTSIGVIKANTNEFKSISTIEIRCKSFNNNMKNINTKAKKTAKNKR